MMDWSDALLGVQEEKENQKSVADEAQQQLVPSQQGSGQSPEHGQGRPVYKGKKKGEEQEQQLSTDSDSIVDVVADIVAAAISDTSGVTDSGSVSGENEVLKGNKSMLQDQQQDQYPNRQSPTAPLLLSLTDLIDDNTMEIKKNVDVQFLMDFAVIGHPKCGTTFLLRKWLGQHAEIVMPARETRVLSGSTGAVQMVQALYPLQQLPVVPIQHTVPSTSSASGGSYDLNDPPVTIKRGYKNPAHILRPWALQHFETYWPTSKLIIGVRHPVLFFESFYNYRLKRDELPPPASLMGACTDHMNDVCTDNANFHVHLAMLGKTNLTALERVLLETTSNSSTTSTRVPRNPKKLMHLPNPVFLYDVSQLDGSNVDVSESVRRDMQDFLGLQQPLPVLEPVAGSSSTSSARSHSQEPSQHNMNMLDICLPEHDTLRKELLQIAWQASEWITTYFLPLSDVTVPAPEHFRSVLLNDWRNDPCETRKTTLRPSP
jgi:hypothetical protein